LLEVFFDLIDILGYCGGEGLGLGEMGIHLGLVDLCRGKTLLSWLPLALDDNSFGLNDFGDVIIRPNMSMPRTISWTFGTALPSIKICTDGVRLMGRPVTNLTTGDLAYAAHLETLP
jgi:hypothetical protein